MILFSSHRRFYHSQAPVHPPLSGDQSHSIVIIYEVCGLCPDVVLAEERGENSWATSPFVAAPGTAAQKWVFALNIRSCQWATARGQRLDFLKGSRIRRRVEQSNAKTWSAVESYCTNHEARVCVWVGVNTEFSEILKGYSGPSKKSGYFPEKAVCFRLTLRGSISEILKINLRLKNVQRYYETYFKPRSVRCRQDGGSSFSAPASKHI